MPVETPQEERDEVTGTPPDILTEEEVEAQDLAPAPDGLVEPD